MHRNTKIATCCFCGTRAALVLGEDRHELVCSSCGAPLHEMKALSPEPNKSAKHSHLPGKPPKSGKPPKKSKKKKKSTASWFFSEAVDLLDDIFD